MSQEISYLSSEGSFAPVAITTLSRIECLKTTIDSLGRCHCAEYTDVYISVDYPPNTKYKSGYVEVCNYLETIHDDHPFKSLNLYFHKANLGPFENYLWLVRLILSKYDSIIILEDDNEPAPCFLDFCNKALQIYAADNDVVVINPSDYVWCGDGYTPLLRSINIDDCNIEKRQMLWHGMASWSECILPYYNFVLDQSILSIGDHPSALLKLFKRSKSLCYQYLKDTYNTRVKAPWHNGRLYSIDMTWDVAMIVFDKVAICPIENLQRDLGVVGNGHSFTKAFSNSAELQNRKLKEEPEFDFVNPQDAALNMDELILHDKFQSKPWWKWAFLITGYLAKYLQRKLTGKSQKLINPWSEYDK